MLRGRGTLLITLCKGLLAVRIVFDDERARRVGTQSLPALDGQLGGKLESAGALNSLNGDLKVGNGLVIGNGCVGEDKGANSDVAAGSLAVLGKDDLVKVRRDSNRGRAANHLILDIPLVVDGILAREVQRASHDAYRRVADSEAAAKVLKVRPVVAVETLANLGAHVAEVKRLIHGALRPLCVGSGHLVAAVVAAAVVVLEARAKLGGHAVVLDKVAVLAVAVAQRQRRGRDVLHHPVRVARAAVVAGYQRRAVGHVVDGTGEAVLKEARRVDGAVGGDGGGHKHLRRWDRRGGSGRERCGGRRCLH